MNFAVIFSGQGLQSSRHIDEIRSSAEQFGLSAELAPLLEQLEAAGAAADAIFQNQLAQPFIFALQHLRWLQIQAHLPEPEFLAGYSLGEASAFCCSASYTFSQSLALITARAELMSRQLREPCAMAAIQGLNSRQLQPLLQSAGAEISIRLNETHYIAGGAEYAVEQLQIDAKTHGAQHAARLKVSIPSHTSLLKDAAAGFSDYLQGLPRTRMNLPVISASDGQKYSTQEQAAAVLSHQIDHPLDWYRCMETLQEYRPNVILEIGPGNALSKMLQETMPEVQIRSVDDFSSFSGVEQWISRFL